MQGKKSVQSDKMASPLGEPQDVAKDLMAFVRYGPQNYVISLNPYDGWEQWQRMLSGLASVPVEIVLLPPKAACAHDKGISILDRRSYLEAMKIVEIVRQTKEVLRFVLYPVKDDANPELQKLVSSLSMNAKNEVSKADMKHGASASTDSRSYVYAAEHQAACPQWASEMKKEMMDSIDQRFHELLTSVDSKLSLFGSQMTESLVSLATVSPLASSQKSGSVDSGSLLVANVEDHNRSLDGLDSELPHTAFNMDVPKWIDGLMDTSNNMARISGSFSLTTPANSECGSIVVVTPPESFDLLGFSAAPGNTEAAEISRQSCEFEILKTDDVEINSETGSVVYVETDGEEEDDFANLRSWAGEGKVPNAPVDQEDQLENNTASMEQSFHSVTTEPVVQETIEPVVQETIVYKPVYVEVEDHVEDSVNIPTAGESAQPSFETLEGLPADLNAMQPIEEQNLFSPNSDIGTMLLSAASTIATGFMQSMESLSRTISAYEQRRGHPSPVVTANQQMPNIGNEGMADDQETAADIPEEIAAAIPPPVPPRTHRGPPPSMGMYMSPEEIMWYLQEYGIPDQIGEAWTKEAMTHDTFSLRVSEYFDRCG